MSGRNLDYATEAFDFIDGLDHLATPEDVVDAVAKSFTLFGFENFIITGLPNPKERFEHVVLLKKWPKGWYDIYAKEDYVRSDPIIRLCRTTAQPFEWSEAPYNRDTEPKAAEIMDRATDFRMKEGFCLPIHGINGYEACFSMSGINLDPRHSNFDGLAWCLLSRHFDSVRDLRVDRGPSDRASGAGARSAPRAWRCQTVKITVSRI